MNLSYSRKRRHYILSLLCDCFKRQCVNILVMLSVIEHFSEVPSLDLNCALFILLEVWR
jgi:hypothetical protein